MGCGSLILPCLLSSSLLPFLLLSFSLLFTQPWGRQALLPCSHTRCPVSPHIQSHRNCCSWTKTANSLSQKNLLSPRVIVMENWLTNIPKFSQKRTPTCSLRRTEPNRLITKFLIERHMITKPMKPKSNLKNWESTKENVHNEEKIIQMSVDFLLKPEWNHTMSSCDERNKLWTQKHVWRVDALPKWTVRTCDHQFCHKRVVKGTYPSICKRSKGTFRMFERCAGGWLRA